MGWVPILALPNINVKVRVEGRYAAIVGYHDRRLSALRRERPRLRSFLNGFRDAFGRVCRPSVLMLHRDTYDTYRLSEAIAGFRDLTVASVVPYARASVIIYRRSALDPVFSNAFAFYPWMMDSQDKGMIAATPAMLARDELSRFAGRTMPEIGYYPVMEADDPLLGALIDRWETRFDGTSPSWRDRALFRSLTNKSVI